MRLSHDCALQAQQMKAREVWKRIFARRISTFTFSNSFSPYRFNFAAFAGTSSGGLCRLYSWSLCRLLVRLTLLGGVYTLACAGFMGIENVGSLLSRLCMLNIHMAFGLMPTAFAGSRWRLMLLKLCTSPCGGLLFKCKAAFVVHDNTFGKWVTGELQKSLTRIHVSVNNFTIPTTGLLLPLQPCKKDTN